VVCPRHQRKKKRAKGHFLEKGVVAIFAMVIFVYSSPQLGLLLPFLFHSSSFDVFDYSIIILFRSMEHQCEPLRSGKEPTLGEPIIVQGFNSLPPREPIPIPPFVLLLHCSLLSFHFISFIPFCFFSFFFLDLSLLTSIERLNGDRNKIIKHCRLPLISKESLNLLVPLVLSYSPQ